MLHAMQCPSLGSGPPWNLAGDLLFPVCPGDAQELSTPAGNTQLPVTARCPLLRDGSSVCITSHLCSHSKCKRAPRSGLLSRSTAALWSLGEWGSWGSGEACQEMHGESSLATLTQGWANGAHCWGKAPEKVLKGELSLPSCEVPG